jgi:hypothetical protein
MNCGPDNKEKTGDDENRGGGCRDPIGYGKCMTNVVVNLAIDLHPLGGLAKSSLGVKIDLFNGAENLLSTEGPGIDAGATAVEKEVKGNYNSSGGDTQLKRYDSLARRNGLGKGARAARSQLSALKPFVKSLPLLGDALDLWDAANDSASCYRAYCK